MAADITSLSIQVKSDGIAQVTTALEKLVGAAEKVEKVIPLAGAATNKLSESNSSAASGIEKLLENFKKQADLMGKNTAESNGYTAALKGATDEQLKLAKASGASVDSYKALSNAQKEALSMNKALDASNASLEKTLNPASRQNQLLGYKALKAAQTEAIAMNKALLDSEQALGKQMKQASIMDKARDWKLLGAAQAEGLAMNKALDASHAKGATSLASNTAGLRLNNVAMGDAHALVRGLTGSFNSLWLSYGNFAGMAIGLAIGASLKSIVSVGKDVENTLEGIRVKGDESVESITLMRTAILEIGKGVYGPQEVAKAFETLILAGLTAKEAMIGIKDALNLATVGGTTIEKASSTLVQVSTALGYTASGFGTVADVIAKTAAVSMSSVESLSEAFKSGSAIGKLYGASLVDIGTALGALSQLGIQGSAAGTSLKNFYKELGTDTDKLKKTLESMKMVPADLKDANGKFLDLVTVIERLSAGLDQLKPAQQQLAMQMLANERGMKTTVELLDMFRKKTEDSGNQLKTFHDLIADSFGYAAIGAAQMALTVDAQFKTVKNTLSSTFASVFKDIEPQLLVVSVKLREAFGSDTFKEAVGGLAVSVANLTLMIIENINGITMFIAALLTFKSVLFVATSVTALAEAFSVLVKVIEATRFAAIALQLSLGIIGVALITAGAAFAYFYLQRDGDKAKQEAAQVSVDEYVKSLGAEADRMHKINEELLAGRSSKEADVKITQDQAMALSEKNRQTAIDIEQTKVNNSLNALLKNDPTTILGEGKQKQLEQNYATQLKGLASVESQNKISRDNELTNLARVRGEARLTASLEETRIKKEREEALKNAGNGVINTAKPQNIGLTQVNAEIDALKEQSAEIKNSYDNQLSLLDNLHKSKRISDGIYANATAETLRNQSAAVVEYYNKELDVLSKFSSTKEGLNNQALSKEARVRQERDKFIADAAYGVQRAYLAEQDAVRKTLQDEQDASDKIVESVNKQTQAIQFKIDAYNRLPSAVRASGVTTKQLQDEITQSAINDLQTQADLLQTDDLMQHDINAQRLKEINDQIKAREKLRDVQFAEEAQVATNKAILDYNVQWKAANKKIGDDLASAIIEGGGVGWKKLITDMKLAFAKLILQPILAPISSAFATATTGDGAGGVLGQATGATGAVGSGGVSSLVSLASAANSAYKAISTGFASVGSTVTNAVQGAMNFAQGGSSAASMGAYGPTAAGGNIATGATAQAAGTAATYAAGIAAGKLVGSAISGDYGVGNHGSAVVNIGTAIGAIWGPLGAALGGAIGGLVNRAFGMGSKNVQSAGITGTASETGVTGNNFADWTQKGGWFRSDKSGTDTSNLSSDVVNTFKSTLVTLKGVSVDFAKNVNVGSDALLNYSKNFNLVLGSDAAANQKTITDFFTTMGDDMATKLIPNIADFALISETASTTLQRLSGVFAATNNLAGILGRTVEQTFGSIGLSSYAARQRLIDLAGSLANLNTQVTFYATNFLTEADKIAPVQAAVTAALAAMGWQAVTTTEQFTNVVKGLDLTTQAGAEQFAALMALAPAFKQVADYTKAALATMVTDATNKLDTLKKVAGDSFTIMSNLLGAQKTVIVSLQSALQSALGTVVTSVDTLMTRAQAQAKISAAIDTAKSTGVLPTAESLASALAAVSTPNNNLYATSQDAARDAGVTAGKLTELAGMATDQITVIDKQLAFAQAQLDALNDVKTLTADVGTAIRDFNTALQAALVQKDVLATVIATSTTAAVVAQAAIATVVAKVSPAVQSTYVPPTTSAPTTPKATPLYDAAVARYQALQDQGRDAGTLQEYLANRGVDGSHATGLDNVPFDGYTAKLHKGEMVLPASSAQAVRSDVSIAEIVAAIETAMQTNSAENQSMASNLQILRKLFQQAMPGGNSLQTTTYVP